VVDLALVLGTRPEIIKLSPVIRACERRSVPYTLIHTGQHYSDDLDTVFFEQLDLPEPDYNLGAGSGTHGQQTGRMLIDIEAALQSEEPDVVLVQGDTNSMLAGALATSKLDPAIGHVEAGLRSFDREMPEEINRVVTDHIADYLFAPTESTRSLLLEEGIDDERIHVVGNTIVDAVLANRELAAERSTVLADMGLSRGGFILLTAHRPENVDDPERLDRLLEGAASVARMLDIPVIYPIHPRTKDRLDSFAITVPDVIRLIEPLDFLDFLRLEDTALLAITDSGGVQEETCILHTPCVTVRDSTERPETVEVGANTIVGVNPDAVRDGAREMISRDTDWENPFGDGTAAEQILDLITGVEQH
jgi:UDP-N-acetylglucosamine 2-epimerase (non-hydrolysing)